VQRWRARLARPGPELLVDGGHQFLRGAHRHRGFFDHDLVGLHVAGDVAAGREHVAQVGVARDRVGRRADRDEDHVAMLHGARGVGRELEPSLLGVAPDEFGQTLFVDRNTTAAQAVDPMAVDVQADDLVADFRKACGRNQADIAGTNDRDPHGVRSALLLREGMPARERLERTG
jgi:hypothetical protein